MKPDSAQVKTWIDKEVLATSYNTHIENILTCRTEDWHVCNTRIIKFNHFTVQSLKRVKFQMDNYTLKCYINRLGPQHTILAGTNLSYCLQVL